jgi:hypothetical protein
MHPIGQHQVRSLFIGSSGAVLLGYPDTTQQVEDMAPGALLGSSGTFSTFTPQSGISLDTPQCVRWSGTRSKVDPAPLVHCCHRHRRTCDRSRIWAFHEFLLRALSQSRSRRDSDGLSLIRETVLPASRAERYSFAQNGSQSQRAPRCFFDPYASRSARKLRQSPISPADWPW